MDVHVADLVLPAEEVFERPTGEEETKCPMRHRKPKEGRAQRSTQPGRDRQRGGWAGTHLLQEDANVCLKRRAKGNVNDMPNEVVQYSEVLWTNQTKDK